MTFVSYAQNYEDVMLRRAFKDIKKGFYIDVGANDSVIDSVTKAFYDSDWHGINIEPVTEWFIKLQEARPNDTNLKLACGERKGQNTIYNVVGTGLSTMDKSIADKHANELDFEIKKEKIKVDSLTNICKQYANQDIHFLKIDVEGFELQVLKGLDLKKIRPWIIVIEATLPNSQIEDYGKWESILTNGQYNFVYFDGLNRFYVASEHDELDDSFNVPPNYFDFFRRSSEQWALDELKASEQKVSAKENEISLVTKDLGIANKELSERSANIDLLTGELKASEQKVYAKENEKSLIAKDLDIANKELSERSAELDAQRSQAEHLTTELGTAREQRATAEAVRDQLALSIQEAEQRLNTLNKEKVELKEQHEQLHAHDKWLQDEWDASNVKIDELNASSHHWWLESDRINKELQTVYGSKSWKTTWPLRKLMQFTKWLFFIPIRLVIWIVRLPKRTIRWLLVKAMAFVLKRPAFKLKTMNWLRNYPSFTAKLQRLAQVRGLVAAQLGATPIPAPPILDSVVTEPVAGNETSNCGAHLPHLTPSAQRIYRELKAAIEEGA